jgi:hypothetical protein
MVQDAPAGGERRRLVGGGALEDARPNGHGYRGATVTLVSLA